MRWRFIVTAWNPSYVQLDALHRVPFLTWKWQHVTHHWNKSFFLRSIRHGYRRFFRFNELVNLSFGFKFHRCLGYFTFSFYWCKYRIVPTRRVKEIWKSSQSSWGVSIKVCLNCSQSPRIINFLIQIRGAPYPINPRTCKRYVHTYDIYRAMSRPLIFHTSLYSAYSPRVTYHDTSTTVLSPENFYCCRRRDKFSIFWYRKIFHAPL